MKIHQKLVRKWAQVRGKPLPAGLKLTAVAGMTLTAGMLVLMSLSSFFSDYTSSSVAIDLKIPNVLQIKNLKLDTHTGIKTDPTVTAENGTVTHEGDELVTFDHFVLSDIVTLSFDIVNTGTETMTVSNSVMKLAWDNAGLDKVKGYVYVYPTTMSDDAIRTNINAGGNQALTNALTDSQLTMNDGTTAKGLQMTLTGGTGTLAAGASKSYTYKVVYARDNDVKQHADFLPFNAQDLKVDLYTEGSTPRYTILRDSAEAVLTAETMPMMMATSGTAATAKFWNAPADVSMLKQQVDSIKFVDRDVKTLGAPTNDGNIINPLPVLGSWDVSEAQDGTILAWYTPTATSAGRVDGDGSIIIDSATRYNLYVGGQNGVLSHAGGTANATFSYFTTALSIDATWFEVCESRNLSNLFYSTSALLDAEPVNGTGLIGIENWHTRNATTMGNMFSYSASLTALDLSAWDVSNVNNMASMFSFAVSLEEVNMTGWTTTKVTTMQDMFNMANSLQKVEGITAWDTANVTTMQQMFRNAGTVAPGLETLDLSGWDVGKVTSMLAMFQGANKLKTLDTRGWTLGTTATTIKFSTMFQNTPALESIAGITDWDTSKVTTMSDMFSNSGIGPTLDLHTDGNKWNVSKVTDMNQMFSSASKLKEVNTTGWQTGQVTGMQNMFYNANILEKVDGITDWDTGNVTTMFRMFRNAGSTAPGLVSLDLSDWDVGKVTTMAEMFYDAKQLKNLDTTDWTLGTTATTINFGSMFRGTSALESIAGITDWDTSKVTIMSSMFDSSGIGPTLDLHTDGNKWNVSKVTIFQNMFMSATNLVTVDTTGWQPGIDTTATNFVNMFCNANRLQEVTGITDWDTSKVTTMSSMFQYAGTIAPGLTTLDLHTDGSKWDVSKVSSFAAMFGGATNLVTVDTTGWQPGVDATATTFANMFYDTRSLQGVTGITDWDTNKVTIMSGMFQSSGITALDLHTVGNKWDVSKVTTFQNMFTNANKLTTVDTTGWQPGVDTASTTFTNMFYNANSLQEVTGITDWDTSKVTNMASMFQSAGAIAPGLVTLDLRTAGNKWNVSKVTTFQNMFLGMYNLATVDTTGWQPGVDTASTTFANMFSTTSMLQEVTGITDWDTSKVTNMASMFQHSGMPTLDLHTDGDKWDTSQVTTMARMFSNANQLRTVTTTGWQTDKVTDMGGMFSTTQALQNIVGIADWDTSNVTNMSQMFYRVGIVDTPGMTTLDLSGWDVSKVTGMYGMFAESNRLVTLNVTGWTPGLANATAGTDMSYMFGHDSRLQSFDPINNTGLIGLESWNTSKVINMSSMFDNARGLTTLDLRSWQTDAVTDMTRMFNNTVSLTALDMRAATLDKAETVYTGMFTSSNNANLTMTVRDADTVAHLNSVLNPKPANIVVATP